MAAKMAMVSCYGCNSAASNMGSETTKWLHSRACNWHCQWFVNIIAELFSFSNSRWTLSSTVASQMLKAGTVLFTLLVGGLTTPLASKSTSWLLSLRASAGSDSRVLNTDGRINLKDFSPNLLHKHKLVVVGCGRGAKEDDKQHTGTWHWQRTLQHAEHTPEFN